MRHVALLSLLCLSLGAPAYSATQQELKEKLAEARLKAESAAPHVSRAAGSNAAERTSPTSSHFFGGEKTIMTMDAPVDAPAEMMQDKAGTIIPSMVAKAPSASATRVETKAAPKGKQILAQIKDSDTPDVVPITTIPKQDAVTKKIAKAEADLKAELQASREKAAIEPAKAVVTTEKAVQEKTVIAKAAPVKPLPVQAAPVKTTPAVAAPIVAVPAKAVPAKTVASSTVVAKNERFELPQAMPAPKQRILDSTKQIDVAPPSVMDAVPAVPVMQPQSSIAKSRIPASPARGTWAVRLVGADDLVAAKGKDASHAFCLMENRFENSASLMIAQRADGYSTLGVNYGIDMLELGRSYSTMVQIDQTFEENFNGYAETDRMLVVQLGKKQSLFASLLNAEGLYVHVPGSASGFSVQGVGTALDKFTQCLSSIGGNLSFAPAPVINPQQTMPAVAAPIVTNDALTPPAPVAVALPDPVVATPKTASIQPRVTPVAKPVAAPVMDAPVMPSPVVPAPVVSAPVIAQKKAQTVQTVLPTTAVPPASIASPIAALTVVPSVNAPVTSSIVAPTIPATVTAPVNARVAHDAIAETPVAAAPVDGWSDYITKILKASGLVTPNMQQSAATKEWTDPQGMHGQVWRLAGTDLLDAALSQMDAAEKECKGQFSNQMGAPEMVNGNAVQLMESKCVSTNGTSVSTWLLHQNQTGITAWEFSAPQNLGSRPFDARSKIMETLGRQS